jgi:ATP-dependent DNA helicase RecG
MALPVNIKHLVNGQTIEWARLEFKQGWNPEDVMHSMCAFANDLHNWGGGYIIIGVAEQEGQPVLPPVGLQVNQLDPIQKAVLELGHKIQPNYFPIMQPYVLDGQHILVLWCPAGDNRIYLAPVTLGKGAQRVPFVRVGSSSIIAKGVTLTRLQELTARIPFDDRVNNHATIDDLDLGLIREYLQEIKSDLFNESAQMVFTDLCKTMLIVKGPNEDMRPVNVGLLFFTKQPEKFFNRAWIELVWHSDNSGKKFKEVYFKGPLHKQLREAFSFIQTNIITSQVSKLAHKAESEQFFNYPFAAIEEALSNAVYHKSYELGSPIEIQVFPDKMTILSYPGPVPPVNAKILSTHRTIIAREYRNRRIGDILKELRLTEGRGTGFPTIYRALEANGSPAPVFETDDENYVLVTISARKIDQATDGVNHLIFNDLDSIIAFCNGVSDGASDGASDGVRAILEEQVHNKVETMLDSAISWIKRDELFSTIGLSNHSTNRKKYLDPLIEIGWITMEYPDKPTNPNQRYKTTPSGKKLKELING